MSDLGNLRGRIDRAVQQLSDIQTTRSRGSQALVKMLAELEEKYRAREVELDRRAARLEALTGENRQLIELADRLVAIVETTIGDVPDDPVLDAAALASQMLETWGKHTDEPATRDRGPGQSEDAPAPAAEELDGWDTVPEQDVSDCPERHTEAAVMFDKAGGTEAVFEDVDSAVLARETDGEIDDGHLPEAVLHARALAQAVEDDIGVNADGPTGDVDSFALAERRALDDRRETAVQEETLDVIDREFWPVGAAIAQDVGRAAQTTGREIGGSEILIEEDEEEILIEEVSSVGDIEIPIIAETTEAEASLEPGRSAEDQEANIRAMMARLEQAAERAKADGQPEPEPETDPLIAGTSSN